MSHTDRLASYFRCVGPNNLVTMEEITDLLWRGCPQGGPLNTPNSIRQQIIRVKRKYGYDFECIKQFGYRMKDTQHGQVQA